ncbi:hypothetical protein NHL50_02955 [Acidimicrobiia bacterium EGI L10123]|uniref:hypothetical protein n=1 Tax=Salinilacustrithrix flava TaxID=2957203 RepID=UPI003D7C1E40|nr:hypothetical protein [Acidimicrobiia bacterium EGI L10123]
MTVPVYASVPSALIGDRTLDDPGHRLPPLLSFGASRGGVGADEPFDPDRRRGSFEPELAAIQSSIARGPGSIDRPDLLEAPEATAEVFGDAPVDEVLEPVRARQLRFMGHFDDQEVGEGRRSRLPVQTDGAEGGSALLHLIEPCADGGCEDVTVVARPVGCRSELAWVEIVLRERTCPVAPAPSISSSSTVRSSEGASEGRAGTRTPVARSTRVRRTLQLALAM